MIVNKYHMLFLNHGTKKIESDTINASHMKEAIERCEAKYAFKINVLACTDTIVDSTVPALSIPATLAQLIALWNSRREQAIKIGNQIHERIDMLIGCGEFKEPETDIDMLYNGVLHYRDDGETD